MISRCQFFFAYAFHLDSTWTEEAESQTAFDGAVTDPGPGYLASHITDKATTSMTSMLPELM
jgi:hypothetical protein